MFSAKERFFRASFMTGYFCGDYIVLLSCLVLQDINCRMNVWLLLRKEPLNHDSEVKAVIELYS